MEEDCIVFEYKIPFNFFISDSLKNSVKYVSIKAHKNKSHLLSIYIENFHTKIIEVKLKRTDVFKFCLSVLRSLLGKMYTFNSFKTKENLEKNILNYISNEDLFMKHLISNNDFIKTKLIIKELLEYIQVFSVIINKKLFVLIINEKNLYIFSKNYKLMHLMNLNLITIIDESNKTIKINYSHKLKKIQFKIYFFSKLDKIIFLKEKLLIHNNTEFQFIRKSFLKASLADKYIMKHFKHLNSSRIKKINSLYYNKNVYQIINDDYLEKLLNSKIVEIDINKLVIQINFIFNYKLIDKVSRIVLYMKIDFQEKDEFISSSINCLSTVKENDIIVEDEKFNNISKRKRSSKMSNHKRIPKMERSHTFIIKPNPTNVRDDVYFLYPSFNRLTFDVIYKAEKSTIQIDADGIMRIFKYGKMDKFVSFTIDEINLLEGNNPINNSIFMKINQKNEYQINFMNNYENYIFKSVVHNHRILKMKREFIKNQLKLNINIMTWNVAVIDVPSDLKKLIIDSKIIDNCDIFSFGVQECGILKKNYWLKIIRTIAALYDLYEVRAIEMFQMFLIVFIKNDLVPLIENIESKEKAMGFGNFLGNKGGLVISFKLMGFNFVFVNCHLAPKVDKTLERHVHIKTLIKNIRVGQKFCEFDTLADYLFWQGDLNYRVDYKFYDVLKEINNNNIDFLLTKDQLHKERQKNQIFYQFLEAPIKFNPTYRRVKGKDDYSNKKDQSPSWCDRILIKTNRNLDNLFYESIKDLKMSDHLPVVGKFSTLLTIPTFDNLEKDLNDFRNKTNIIDGRFLFSKITLEDFFFEGIFDELKIKVTFPIKLKLSVYYFMNSKCSESNVEVKDEKSLKNKICFEEIRMNYMSQLFFNCPHSKANNIFFVLSAIINKTTFEIGYSKYCLEDIERNHQNSIAHNYIMDVTFRTVHYGMLSISAYYRFSLF